MELPSLSVNDSVALPVLPAVTTADFSPQVVVGFAVTCVELDPLVQLAVMLLLLEVFDASTQKSRTYCWPAVRPEIVSVNVPWVEVANADWVPVWAAVLVSVTLVCVVQLLPLNAVS